MTSTLAVVGAAGGAVGGHMLEPDVPGVVASLAVAGFGLGGAIGVVFGGGWRSPKLQAAAPEPEPEPVVEEPPEPEMGPEPELPPPPEGSEPGWYPWPDGTRRFWDGETWTAHVWRERRVKR